MGMDKINSSSLLQSGMLDSARQNNKVDEKKKPEAQATEAVPAVSAPASGDTAEISETAHRLMELRQAVETGRVAMAGLPELREDKIALARERLESGFYNSAEVRDKVATGIDAVITSMEKM